MAAAIADRLGNFLTEQVVSQEAREGSEICAPALYLVLRGLSSIGHVLRSQVAGSIGHAKGMFAPAWPGRAGWVPVTPQGFSGGDAGPFSSRLSVTNEPSRLSS